MAIFTEACIKEGFFSGKKKTKPHGLITKEEFAACADIIAKNVKASIKPVEKMYCEYKRDMVYNEYAKNKKTDDCNIGFFMADNLGNFKKMWQNSEEGEEIRKRNGYEPNLEEFKRGITTGIEKVIDKCVKDIDSKFNGSIAFKYTGSPFLYGEYFIITSHKPKDEE